MKMKKKIEEMPLKNGYRIACRKWSEKIFVCVCVLSIISIVIERMECFPFSRCLHKKLARLTHKRVPRQALYKYSFIVQFSLI